MRIIDKDQETQAAYITEELRGNVNKYLAFNTVQS
jgi:hypothetical protein